MVSLPKEWLLSVSPERLEALVFKTEGGLDR